MKIYTGKCELFMKKPMAGVPNITEIRMKLNVEVATVLHLVE
jgi:hypothetical protein